MTFPNGRPITVVRGRGFDLATGDPTAATSTVVLEGYGWAPRSYGTGSTREPDGRSRQGVIEGLMMYGPAADIRHTDGVILDARVDLADVGAHTVWDVEGEVGEWQSPLTGWAPGVEVALRRADG